MKNNKRQEWASFNIVTSVRVKFGAGDHRMLGILSYFHRVVAPLGTTTNLARSLRWTFDEPLTTRTPYEVPFNRIRIKFVHGEVPFSQTLQALNGAVVGLVIDETQYDTPSGRSDDVTVANDDDDEVNKLSCYCCHQHQLSFANCFH